MKKVVIIDDESKAREDLKTLINTHCPDLVVVGEADGVDTGTKLIQASKPHAVFLDIAMQDGLGFDPLDRFDHYPFQIIFQTAYDEFAIKAFKYNAIDYLLKPISIEELKKTADKITVEQNHLEITQQLSNLLRLAKKRTLERIILNSSEGMHFVDLVDIIRLQSDGNYTTFFLHSGERIIVTKIIKYFEELLPDDTFFRPHQSHIVQLKYVKKILRKDGGYALMSDGSKIPISRKKKDLFITHLRDKASNF